MSSYTIGDFGVVNFEKDEIVNMKVVWVEIQVRCEFLLKNVRHVSNICLDLILVIILNIEGNHNF